MFNSQINRQLFSGLSKTAVYGLLLIASIGIGFAVAKFGLEVGAMIIVVILGLPMLVYMFASLKFGVIMLLILSFFLARISSFFVKGFPLGTVIDVFLLIMFIGLVIRKIQRRDFNIAKGPISYVIWIWIIYNFLQVGNPMQTMDTWIYAIRSMAGHMIFYFIALEALDDIGFFKKLVVIWVGLAFLGALYGLFQEFHGLLQIEKDWVAADPRRYNLYTIWGKYRIFSYFNDPTVYGILMSFTGLFCLLMLNLKEISFFKKLVFFVCAAAMLWAVVYTGTRTAYAMLPAGIGFFALITFQKKTILFTSFIFFVGAGIIFSNIQSLGPIISASTLSRIRSTFNPSEDPSYLVRMENQAFIKPFIQSHPLGAGIGTLGTVGKRFNPDASLTGFDADSMYVKVAVELGWVGLLIYCAFLITILIIGIKNYYRIRDPNLKIYMAGLVAVVYSIVIANYTQMATLQLPNAFIFYVLIASIVKLPQFDKLKEATI